MFPRTIIVMFALATFASGAFAQMEHDPYQDSPNDGFGYEKIVVRNCYRNFAPIHIAAARGDVARLKQELAEGVPVDLRVVNQGGSGSWRDTTPLMWAAMMGNAECVKLLLEAGADVKAKSSSGLTPLVAAAGAVPQINGDELERMMLIIKAGANVDAADSYGNCALTSACGCSAAIDSPPDHRIREDLVDRRPDRGDLIRPNVGGSIGYSIEPRSPRVVMHGDVERVKALLAAGADVSATMPNGGSILSRVIHDTDACG